MIGAIMKLSIRLNAIFKILLTTFNIIIPIFVGPYVIRMLSRTSYDTFSKASVEIQLFLTLATLGFYTYGIRSISKIRQDKQACKRLFSELLLVEIIANVFFFLMYLLYIMFINNHQGEVIYFILMIQFLGSSVSVEWMHEALEDYRFITFKSIAVKVLYIVLILLFVKGDDITIYGMIISFTFVLDNVLSFVYILFKRGVTLRGLQFKKHFKPLLLIFLITNISLLYTHADKMMLGLLLSDSAVATYNIPSYIVTSIYNIIISIFIVAIPRLNEYLTNKQKDDYLTLYNELVQTFCLIFIPLLVFTFIFSDDIIILYAANKYNDSIIPLKAFTIVIFLNALVYLQREGVCYLHEKEKRIITYNLIGGLFNVSSNLLLYFLGLFNPLTAIITLGISFLIVNVLLRIYIYRKIDSKIILINKNIIFYFLSSLVIVGIDYLFSIAISNLIIRLMVTFGSAVIVYLLILVIIRDKIIFTNIKVYLGKLRRLKNSLK